MNQSAYTPSQGMNSRFGDHVYRGDGNQVTGVQQRHRPVQQMPEPASIAVLFSAQILPAGLEVAKVTGGARLSPALAPVRAVLKLQQYWKLTGLEMARMSGLSSDDAEEIGPALSRHFMLPAVQDRLRSAMSIRSRLSALFSSDQEAELKWLRHPWAMLNERQPLDLLTSRDIFVLEAVVREFAGG